MARSAVKRLGGWLLALLLAAGLAALGAVLFHGGFRSFEERSTDLIWRLSPLAGEERRLIVVDIDEASLSAVGPWPWPRETLAELARGLTALGVRQQVFDIVLPESRPGDAALRQALLGTSAVLAQVFALDDGHEVAIGRLGGALRSPACGPPIPNAVGYIANSADFVDAAAGVGHITPRVSPDGTVRSIPALVCSGDRVYPTLALAALTTGAGLAPQWELDRNAGWLEPPWTLRHPGFPGVTVPLDAHGDARVSYRLPRSAFISVSAKDILGGAAPRELLNGAWVLVGATAFGVGDAVPTPLGRLVAGVEVHAQFIAGLLDGRAPYIPNGAAALRTAAAVLGAVALLAVAGFGGRLPVYGLPVAGALLAAVVFAGHAAFLLRGNLLLGWVEPALFLALAGVCLAIVEHARARFERERVFANLSSYLPASVAREVALTAPSGRIDAQRSETAVLVADLRNFSAYCEGRPPEEAAALLHAFFSVAVRTIESHGGVVESFQGDAVIGVWGAADPSPRHVRRAFAAARQLLVDVPKLFPSPPPEGLEPLAIGVGLEAGLALMGSVGPASRRHHTVMGETVTVAIRLQAMTAELAQPLLVGPEAARCLEHADLVSLGEFLLEGMRRNYTLYGLVPDQIPAP